MKVKVISLPYIFQVLYVLCFTRPRYQVSVYRTIGPLVFKLLPDLIPFALLCFVCLLQEIFPNEFTSGDGKPGREIKFTVKFLNFRTKNKRCCNLPKIQTKGP